MGQWILNSLFWLSCILGKATLSHGGVLSKLWVIVYNP